MPSMTSRLHTVFESSPPETHTPTRLPLKRAASDADMLARWSRILVRSALPRVLNEV